MSVPDERHTSCLGRAEEGVTNSICGTGLWKLRSGANLRKANSQALVYCGKSSVGNAHWIARLSSPSGAPQSQQQIGWVKKKNSNNPEALKIPRQSFRGCCPQPKESLWAKALLHGSPNNGTRLQKRQSGGGKGWRSMCYTSSKMVATKHNYMQNPSPFRMGTVGPSCSWARKAAQGREESFRKFRQNDSVGNIF